MRLMFAFWRCSASSLSDEAMGLIVALCVRLFSGLKRTRQATTAPIEGAMAPKRAQARVRAGVGRGLSCLHWISSIVLTPLVEECPGHSI